MSFMLSPSWYSPISNICVLSLPGRIVEWVSLSSDTFVTVGDISNIILFVIGCTAILIKEFIFFVVFVKHR